MSDLSAARLKQARVAAKFATAEGACVAFGWKAAAYRHHEGGVRSFDIETAIRYARAFKVSPAWLLGLADDPGEQSASAKTSDAQSTRSLSADDGAIEIKSIDLSYAMGPGTNIDDYADETPVLYDPGFLRAITRAEATKLFAARASGDSMFPTLINDDQVIVDTSQRVLNMQDRIWAVSVHGAGMIKRLRSAGGGMVRVLSDNTAVPPDEVSVADLHIVGRVIWIGRRV